MPFMDYMGYEPEMERWRRRRPLLEELLASRAEPNPPLPVPPGRPQPVPPLAPAPSEPISPPDLGPEPPPLSRLEQKLNERNAIASAHPSAPVKQLPGGGYTIGAPQKPSRLRQAIGGGLLGAAVGGEKGDPWRALGGALTGAAIGAVSPKTIQAFSRAQMVDELDRKLAVEQQQQLGLARIEETSAQAEQRRLEPYLRAAQLQRQIDEDAAQERHRESTSKSQQEANRIRDEALKERIRRNKELGTKVAKRANQYRTDTTTGDIIEIDPNTSTTRVIRRGTKQHGAVAQAQAIWKAAGDQYNNDAKPKFDEADSLREEAGRLGATMIDAKRNEARIKELNRQADILDREAEGIATKVRAMQVEGDKLAAAAAAGGGDKGEDSDTEAAIRAKAAERGLDPDEAVRRWRARSRK